MPLIDGHQATRRIRDYEGQMGLPRVPICALTANATSDVRIKCLDNGFDDFISKPFRRNDLKQILINKCIT
jgi:CheY-like chemotaxis protein